jgi:hypothetical protein
MSNIEYTLNSFIRSNVFSTDGDMAALTDESLQNLVRTAPNISG